MALGTLLLLFYLLSFLLFIFFIFILFILNVLISGIIATNKWDAEETAQTIMADWKELQSNDIKPVNGINGLQSILHNKGLRTVSFSEWKKIDEEEKKRGKEKGKPLEKITIVSDMIDLISTNNNK